MKVSDFLRKYKINGKIPDDQGDAFLNYVSGWLIGRASSEGLEDRLLDIEMAIKVAEAIELRATGTKQTQDEEINEKLNFILDHGYNMPKDWRKKLKDHG